MLNDLFRTYKKIITIILILLCMVVFWFFGCHRQNETKRQTSQWDRIALNNGEGQKYRFQTDNVEGTVVFGTRGYLVKDRNLPVTVNITSKGKKGFTGTLKVTLPGESGKSVAYQSAVRCKNGVTSKVILEVPQLGNASFFCFEIIDQYGAVEISETITDDAGKNEEGELSEGVSRVCIGVMSWKYADYSPLNGMKFHTDEEEYEVTLVRLTKDTFPSRVEGLRALSGIIIDDYPTDSLNGMQRECLKKWIEEEGGALLLGTGENAKTVLKGLSDIVCPDVKEQSETDISVYDEGSLLGNVMVATADLVFSEKENWDKVGSFVPACRYMCSYGKGFVNVLTYSLTDKSLLQWTGREQMMKTLFTEFLNLDKEESEINEISLWYIKKALYAFLNSQLPNTFSYGLFFIIYLAALGIFAYYLPRHMKKREYIWFVIPAISIFFTVCMLVRAVGVTGENSSSFSALRVVDSASNQCDIYFLYQNDEGEKATINLVPEVISAEPMDYEYRTAGADASFLRGMEQDYTINNTIHGFDIVFEEAVPGSSHLLKYVMQKDETAKTDCFAQDITMEYSSFHGTVTNISSFDFEKTVMIRGNQYVVLDGVKKGEQRNVSADEVRCWSGYDRENTGVGNDDDTTAIGNLMEFLQQQYVDNEGDMNTLLIAGITGDDDFKLFTDNNTLKNHLAVYIGRFDVSSGDVEDFVADINSSCLENPQDTELQDDILTEKTTKATYIFDSNKVVWALIRNRDSFQGTILAYNYETGKEERILEKWDDCMYCEELEPYISDMNRMILTFEAEEDTDYGSAPVISLITREMK